MCRYGEFYVALGSSISLALLVWEGGGLLKWILHLHGDEPNLVNFLHSCMRVPVRRPDHVWLLMQANTVFLELNVTLILTQSSIDQSKRTQSGHS